LKGWGFEIEEHRPECWTSWPVAALLELLGDAPASIPCITHSMAASTPPEGVVLELRDVGRAETATLAQHQIGAGPPCATVMRCRARSFGSGKRGRQRRSTPVGTRCTR